MSALPRHLGLIMDGNGRWALRRGLPRTAGHQAGAKALKPLLQHAFDLGIPYVTLYAFSSQNWTRPDEEVATLMGLFRHYLARAKENLLPLGVRLNFIGDRTRFEADIVRQMDELERQTADGTKGCLTLALNYGGRDDILCGVNRLLALAAQGKAPQAPITAQQFHALMSAGDLPDVDFIIRTSGEQRLSDFLLWEGAYAELYFTPVLWPDFTPAELDKALDVFSERSRRFGGV